MFEIREIAQIKTDNQKLSVIEISTSRCFEYRYTLWVGVFRDNKNSLMSVVNHVTLLSDMNKNKIAKCHMKKETMDKEKYQEISKSSIHRLTFFAMNQRPVLTMVMLM